MRVKLSVCYGGSDNYSKQVDLKVVPPIGSLMWVDSDFCFVVKKIWWDCEKPDEFELFCEGEAEQVADGHESMLFECLESKGFKPD